MTLSAGMLVTHHLQKQPLPKYHSWPIPEKGFRGGVEREVLKPGFPWPHLQLSQIETMPGGQKGTNPPDRRVLDPHHGWWKSHHPLSSLMDSCFWYKWMADDCTQPELHASEMRQTHKSSPWLKITLLRIENETQAGACTHTALRKATTELGEDHQSLKAGKASWGYSL